MISAKEARTFFSPDKKEIEEHTQGRVNEILNIINRAIESIYENDKKIVIPFNFIYIIIIHKNVKSVNK